MHSTCLRPILFRLGAERAHHAGIALARALGPLAPLLRPAFAAGTPRLRRRLWGLRFDHPLGLAAGFDKDAEAVPGLAALGFSHVEVGTITALAQPGNPTPRVFRLPADRAVINRMGFNNGGAEAAGRRLAALRQGRGPGCVLGVNLGKSKVVELDAALDDYRASVQRLGALADYVVINVSSPNTPGLRDLQSETRLRPLLEGVRAELDRVAPGRPLLLKIAPDLADAGIDAAVDAAVESRLDGLICTNTTIGRGGLSTSPAEVAALGAGGLSGAPLRQRSTDVLARVARRLRRGPRPLPLIGVGGVDNPAAAWEKICHGADLVQLYTGLIYEGPGLVARCCRHLDGRCEELGLRSIALAVGRDL
jgi:dihydroorotate dehydrogenase